MLLFFVLVFIFSILIIKNIKNILVLISNVRNIGKSAGETVTTRKTAQLFEYGSSHQPPRKFILPSFHAKAGEAMDVFKDDLKRRIDIVVNKLAKQNKSRK